MQIGKNNHNETKPFDSDAITEEFSSNSSGMEIPSVAKSNNSSIIIGAVVGVAVVLFILLSSGNSTATNELAGLNKDDGDYSTGVSLTALPDIEDAYKVETNYNNGTPLQYPPKKNTNTRHTSSRIPNQSTSLSQSDQLRLKKLEEKEKFRRRHAPAVVYSVRKTPSPQRQNRKNMSTPFDQQIAELEQMSSGVSLGMMGQQKDSRDSNLQYADKVYSKSVVKARASAPRDLSYMLLEGKIISAILETAINSDLPGKTRAIVDKDVYSDSGNNILIPKGSRLLGEYNTQINRGQKRVYSIWPRVIRPDGVDVALDSPGTDNLGRAGLAGDVDTHFWSRFGTSVLLSIIGAGAGMSGTVTPNVSATDMMRGALYQSFSSTATKSLEESVNIRDTIDLDQGERIKIFVAKDIDFSAAFGIRAAR